MDSINIYFLRAKDEKNILEHCDRNLKEIFILNIRELDFFSSIV